MRITRDNYEQYASLIQQMKGGSKSTNPLDDCDYGNYALRFKPVEMNFVRPNWDDLMTKRDKPLMSDAEFEVAIKDLAKKEFATGRTNDQAYRNLGMRYGEVVSPDRKGAYEASMKKTGGNMNAALMFWDEKGNKTLGYHPFTGTWHNISTDAEFARARAFTSIYHDELKRLENEYGENARGRISYQEIQKDSSATPAKQANSTVGNHVDYKA